MIIKIKRYFMKAEKKCQVPNCKRPVEVMKHQLCKAHANRFYKTGALGNKKVIGRKTHKPLELDND